MNRHNPRFSKCAKTPEYPIFVNLIICLFTEYKNFLWVYLALVKNLPPSNRNSITQLTLMLMIGLPKQFFLTLCNQAWIQNRRFSQSPVHFQKHSNDFAHEVGIIRHLARLFPWHEIQVTRQNLRYLQSCAHCLDLDLNGHLTRRNFWWISGMLETYTIPKW